MGHFPHFLRDIQTNQQVWHGHYFDFHFRSFQQRAAVTPICEVSMEIWITRQSLFSVRVFSIKDDAQLDKTIISSGEGENSTTLCRNTSEFYFGICKRIGTYDRHKFIWFVGKWWEIEKVFQHFFLRWRWLHWSAPTRRLASSIKQVTYSNKILFLISTSSD